MSETTVNLDEIRKEIDRIDKQLLQLLQERRAQSALVSEYKRKEGKAVRDLARESALLADRVDKGRALGLAEGSVKALFHAIIQDSVALQRDALAYESGEETIESTEPDGVKVSKPSNELESVIVCGSPRSFSDRAARVFIERVAAKGAILKHATSIGEVVSKVTSGEIDAGVIPFSNSTTGSNRSVVGAMLNSSLTVVGEQFADCDHAIAGVEGASLSSVTTVVCHPTAELQCRMFLNGLPGLAIRYAQDSAAAAQEVAELRDTSVVALTTRINAADQGLECIVHNVADDSHAKTRFLVVVSELSAFAHYAESVQYRSLLVLETGQEAGALAEILNSFRQQNIALRSLESLGSVTGATDEQFLVECDGHLRETQLSKVVDELKARGSFLKGLGSFAEGQVIKHRV